MKRKIEVKGIWKGGFVQEMDIKVTANFCRDFSPVLCQYKDEVTKETEDIRDAMIDFLHKYFIYKDIKIK